MQNLKKLLAFGLLAVSLFLVQPALGATKTCTSSDDTAWTYTYSDEAARIDPSVANCPLHNTSDFVSALGKIFSAAAAIVAVISGLFILVAAFTYVTSKGDEEKVAKAKDTIIYAMMGLIVAALAYGIPFVVRSLTGI